MRWTPLALCLLVAASCHPTRVVEAPEPDRGDLPPAARPAFALYTAHRTVLVPVDPGAEVVAATGLWILDQQTVRHVRLVTAADLGRADTPRCPACPDLAGTCLVDDDTPLVESRVVSDSTVAAEPFGSPCTCYRTEPRCPELAEPYDEEVGGPHGDAAQCRCEERRRVAGRSLVPVSLVGGVLYLAGLQSNLACSGLSRYDAVAEEQLLTAEPPESLPAGQELLGRVREPFDALGDPTRVTFEPGAGGDPEPAPAASYPYLARGYQFSVGGRAVPGGGGESWIHRSPLRATDCPSAADPCGDGSHFPPLAALDSAGGSFWVATDDSAALAMDAASALRVYRAGEDTPARIHPLRDTETVLGVRFHAHGAALSGAMTAFNAADHGERYCDLATPCAEGALCLVGVCTPLCETDLDCHVRGGCQDFCDARGRCTSASRGGCDEAHRCPADQACAAYVCEELPTLHDGDSSYVDDHGGRGWADRCFVHVRADRYAAAEAACLRGLAQAAEADVIGALLYSLGLAREGTDDLLGAARLYHRSIQVRGDNAAVRERLEAIAWELN